MANKKLVDLDGLKEYHNKLKSNLGTLVDEAVASSVATPLPYTMSDLAFGSSVEGYDLDFSDFEYDSEEDAFYTANESITYYWQDVCEYFYSLGERKFYTRICRVYENDGQAEFETYQGIATPTSRTDASFVHEVPGSNNLVIELYMDNQYRFWVKISVQESN